MASQGTFEDRIGKYKAGDVLIQSWGDYDPGNPLITKGENTAFIALVEAANTEVVTTEDTLKQKRNARRPLCFTEYSENSEEGILNPNCAEQRIIGVHSYVDSLFPDGSSTVDLIKRILDKVRPQYKGATSNKSFTLTAGQTLSISNVANGGTARNTGGTTLTWQEAGSPEPPQSIAPGAEMVITAPSGRLLVNNTDSLKGGKIRLVMKTDKTVSNSPSERTFASIEGFLNEVITLVDGIGGGISYDPPDPLLTVAELTNLKDAIETANAEVATALDEYGTANRTRKNLYDGKDGMADRIAMIKSYLASFPGKKKSEHFIEFSQAIKGT